ncbi:MAG: ABC transporter ATP-binding protein [Planctomycetes bacterium]|nr:ABC transporter ATP-binding protein [Planctomycetota bacterium]
MVPPPTLFEFENLSKRYRSVVALQGVTYRAEPGAIGLLGPNGAGKSTLLKILIGVIRPTSGRGQILGFDIRTGQLRIRQRVGYMPELDCHIPGMNAVQLVCTAGRLTGMPRADALERAHDTLYYVGLGEARYRAVDTFSAGMRQRIKLAMALVHSPTLVFLDEPTNGLDPRGRETMLALIEELTRQRGMSVVLSSHLLPDVERVCDRVIVVSQGRIAASGRISDLKRLEDLSYTLRIHGDLAPFIAAAEAAGATVKTMEERGWCMVFPGAAGVDLIHRCAAATGAQVRHLECSTRALEEVFREAVAG